MQIQPGQLVPLGYGKFVRSDEVVAIEPIIDERGPGRRTHVWVRGVEGPMIASRAETSLADDLVTPPEQLDRVRQLSTTLGRVVKALHEVPPMLRRVIAEEADVDLASVTEEAERVLGRRSS